MNVISPLENIAGPGKALSKEPPDYREFQGLLGSGLARLQDAGNPSNSIEGRFDLVYNAAHALSLAALRWHGYRPTNRYIVFQVIPHTLGLGPDVWRVLAKGHEIRNLGEYEGELNIDDRLLGDMLIAGKKLADAVAALPKNCKC